MLGVEGSGQAGTFTTRVEPSRNFSILLTAPGMSNCTTNHSMHSDNNAHIAALSRPAINRLQQRESYLKNEPMQNRSQTYTAIRKLLGSLDDPFTRFLEPSRLAALRRGTAGQLTAAASPNCKVQQCVLSGA